MNEEGVGALAYSGKLMRAYPLPPAVRSALAAGQGGGRGEGARRSREGEERTNGLIDGWMNG